MLIPSCIKINILLSSSDYFLREKEGSAFIRKSWSREKCISVSASWNGSQCKKKIKIILNIWENWGNTEIWALCVVASEHNWSLGRQGLPEGKVDPRQSTFWELFFYKTQRLNCFCKDAAALERSWLKTLKKIGGHAPPIWSRKWHKGAAGLTWKG